MKWLGLLAGKGSEGSGSRTEVPNEPAIEVREPNETLEFLNGGGFGPVTDGGDVFVIHADPARCQYKNEEVYRGYMEGALFSLHIKVMVKEPLKNLLHMLPSGSRSKSGRHQRRQ